MRWLMQIYFCEATGIPVEAQKISSFDMVPPHPACFGFYISVQQVHSVSF
jgi:hypothetical protein